MSSVRRVFAVVDSDSYLKWAATTLERLSEQWGVDHELRVVIASSPIAPSVVQQHAATAETRWSQKPLEVMKPGELRQALRDWSPDCVLLAATGPVVEWVADMAAALPTPPVLLTGIPGMALPARRRGLRFRRRIHGWIVHSLREKTEYQALLDDEEQQCTLIVSPLPFLPRGHGDHAGSSSRRIDRLVFTTQAKVPSARHQREAILMALHDTAVAHPDVSVVVKVRAVAGEQQTHNELFPYDLLWQDMCANQPQLDAHLITFASGPLSDWLIPGTAHVTVSSTAALESLAVGLPTGIIGDFGVNERLLNAVFLDSGCVMALEDIPHLQFPEPDPTWLRTNYFHDFPSELPATLDALLALRDSGTLVTSPASKGVREWRRKYRNRLRSTLPEQVVEAAKVVRGRR